MNIAVFLPLYLVLGGYHHAASAAPDSPAEGLRVVRGISRRLAPRFQGGLNLVKKLLRNNRLVIAFVKFSGVAKEAGIKRIGQEVRHIVALHRIAAFGFNAVLRKEVGRVFQPPVAFGVEFKRAPHDF